MRIAEARPAPRWGAGLFLFGSALLALHGCGGSPGEGAGEAGEDLAGIELPAGARLYRVTLGGRGAEEHAVPALVEALPGDAVEFVTVDHRVHTVLFPPDSLDVSARSFLAETGQGASPPLVTRGRRYLLFLEDAPPGRYPFLSEGHGGMAHGVVLVTSGADTLPDTGG